jgi:predicted nucleic acid-binding protein
VPSRARDVLLEIASTGAYRPLWSSEILAELDRTLRELLGKRGVSHEETDAYLTRLFRQMETAFPDALVSDWESLTGTVQLPDPDDRHVVAAARAGRADVIVTDNRWPGSPWTTSCSTRSISTPDQLSEPSARSPSAPEDPGLG